MTAEWVVYDVCKSLMVIIRFLSMSRESNGLRVLKSCRVESNKAQERMHAGDLPESARSSGGYKVQTGCLIQARARAIPLEANGKDSGIDGLCVWVSVCLCVCISMPRAPNKQQ